MASVRTEGRIAVVDDEINIAEMIDLSLQAAGYTVERFSDGASAAAWLEENIGDIDLLITDQSMPGLTGAMLAERASAMRPGLPVILCTGYSAQLVDSQHLPQGVSEIVRKPFMPKDLIARVRELIGKQKASGD